MTKILIFFLLAIFLILVIVGIAIKSFRKYLNGIFQNFDINSKRTPESSKEKILYDKDGIVVMKGEANKNND